MRPWDRNLASLGSRHPALAAQLQPYAGAADTGLWSPARSGDEAVCRAGLWLCSRYDPAAEARRGLPPLDEAADLLIACGLGAGYGLEALRVAAPGRPVLLAQDDPLWLAEVLRHRDLSLLWQDPLLEVVVGPGTAALQAVLETWAPRQVQTLAWRAADEAAGGWRGQVEEAVRAAQARGSVNEATYRRFAPLWRRNRRRNEAQAQELRPVAALAGLARDRPAVLAAAGPSLAASLDWLTRVRDRVCLVAVDTAWPALAARALDPDVLVIMDGQYWNARHVDRLPGPRTAVVTEWTGPPRAFRLAPGRTFVAASSVPFQRAREEAAWGALGSLPSGGSVATAAWSLIRLLGCPEVAAAGLDLGYPGGQSHVPGSQFEEALHRRAARLAPAETGALPLRGLEVPLWRPGLDGRRVRSDRRMDLYRRWFAEDLRRPGLRAVNLSPSGTVIDGMDVPPPDYGEAWPVRPPLVLPAGPVLPPPAAAPARAALSALRRARSRWTPAQGVEGLHKLAGAVWGGPLWDGWAGRARTFAARFATPAAALRFVELLDLALAWEDGGGASGETSKSRSRLGSGGRNYKGAE